jgi:hypothetical protein
LCELSVHVPGRVLIGEAMAQAVNHLVYALLHSRKQDGVMEMIQCRLGSEVGKEPWPEDTVVRSEVAARDEAAGGSCCRPYD